MAKFIRVDLPVRMPDGTIKLAKKIIARHTLLALTSPLNGFVDMTVFGTKTTDAETLLANNNMQTVDSQSFFLWASKKCGLAPGQTRDSEGTLYWYVLQIRDILLIKNRGTEETLSQYGYSVVISQTGARKNVRVDIPNKPEDMITLAQAINTKHTALGVSSPLTSALVDMAAFGTLLTEAADYLSQWETAKAEAQALHYEALVKLGYADGQTSDTEGTIYYDMCIIRDRLLQKYHGVEEDLSRWGFNVVISEHSTGGAASGGGGGQAAGAVREVDVAAGMVGNFNLDGASGSVTEAVFEAFGNPGVVYAAANPTEMPGPGLTMPIVPGTVVSKTPTQLLSELGLGPAKPFLNVQNTGTGPGHYKLTLS